MKSFEKRFWKKIIIKGKTECWSWVGCKINGYGRINIEGKNKLASRVMWELRFGKIPEEMCVLHKCDNPECLNINHLFLGTKSENVYDMVSKKRNFIGKLENNGRSKLTKNDAINIRKEYAKGNVFQYQLAKKYGVSQPIISKITRNEGWIF